MFWFLLWLSSFSSDWQSMPAPTFLHPTITGNKLNIVDVILFHVYNFLWLSWSLSIHEDRKICIHLSKEVTLLPVIREMAIFLHLSNVFFFLSLIPFAHIAFSIQWFFSTFVELLGGFAIVCTFSIAYCI